MRAVFAFEDPNLSVPFFRSVGGLLVKVNRLNLLYSVHHKLSELGFPMFAASLRLRAISWSMTSLVSLNGLTTLLSLTRSHIALRCLRNLFCSAADDSGC